jgi:hypothetical protein
LLLLFKASVLILKKIPRPSSKKAQNILPPKVQASILKEASLNKLVRVVVRTKEDSLLKVKVDGRVVYQSVLRRGRIETWTAKEKIELSVGNAAGVELEVGGKIMSPLGRRGESLKNIVITSEGVKIQ